jgi:hypothetical protein
LATQHQGRVNVPFDDIMAAAISPEAQPVARNAVVVDQQLTEPRQAPKRQFPVELGLSRDRSTRIEQLWQWLRHKPARIRETRSLCQFRMSIPDAHCWPAIGLAKPYWARGDCNSGRPTSACVAGARAHRWALIQSAADEGE